MCKLMFFVKLHSLVHNQKMLKDDGQDSTLTFIFDKYN